MDLDIPDLSLSSFSIPPLLDNNVNITTSSGGGDDNTTVVIKKENTESRGLFNQVMDSSSPYTFTTAF